MESFIENLQKIDKEQALFIIEAVCKSCPENLSLCDCTILGGSGTKNWTEIYIALQNCETPQLVRHIIEISKKSSGCKRIINVELDFDAFNDKYQHLLEKIDTDWQYNDPRKVLDEVANFTRKFKVPRIGLRLLLEMASYASSFVSSDLQIIYDIHDEVEKTLEKMPSTTLNQLKGKWFYANGVDDLRNFIDNS